MTANNDKQTIIARSETAHFFNLEDYPDNVYKTLWLANSSYGINILNLISLADREPEKRQEIARQGGIASGKARRKKAYTKQLLEVTLYTMQARDNVRAIIEGYNGRFKDLVNMSDMNTINAYLPLKLLDKLNTINNRLQRKIDRLNEIAGKCRERETV